MKTQCPHCQKALSVPDNYKGKQIKCISCHKVSVAEPITETAKLQVSEQSAQPTSHRNQWIMAIIISVGLAWVIGFACGALLTRPNRDKTNATIAAIEVKAEESQEKAQKELRAAKKETTRLQRELRSATLKLQQTEDDLRRVVAELEDTKNKAVIVPPIESEPIPQRPATAKTPDRISEIRTPIFGVRLGESLRSLQKRLTITANTHYFEDKDHPGEIWNVNPSNSSVKSLLVRTYNGRVYSINILFADGSRTNYDTIREQLRRKYKSEDKGGLPGAMFGEAEFMSTLDGVRIGIKLNHDIGFMEDDKLELNYTHIPLRLKVYEEIQKRKANKVKTDL